MVKNSYAHKHVCTYMHVYLFIYYSGQMFSMRIGAHICWDDILWNDNMTTTVYLGWRKFIDAKVLLGVVQIVAQNYLRQHVCTAWSDEFDGDGIAHFEIRFRFVNCTGQWKIIMEQRKSLRNSLFCSTINLFDIKITLTVKVYFI